MPNKSILASADTTFTFYEDGLLHTIGLSDIQIPFTQAGEYLTLHTDQGDFPLGCNFVDTENTPSSCRHTYHIPIGKAVVTYHVQNGYLTKSLVITPTYDFTLYRISQTLSVACSELIDYKTFPYASSAAFLRTGNHGLYCGFTNPFCTTQQQENQIVTWFEPSLYLKNKEAFECDDYFLGVYRMSGIPCEVHLPKTAIQHNGNQYARYRNPDESTPLDKNEIHAFRHFVDDWFRVEDRKPLFMSYNFFSNLPQRPNTPESVAAYRHHIDTFAKIGGELLLLNPLHPNDLPTADPDSCWEVAPDNTSADEIMQYARSKGLKLGMYMGTAGNGIYGNGILTPYASPAERPLWKKRGRDGVLWEENCIASKDFTDWYIRVQLNTIRKYGFALWNWDPGPGNARFCYSADHGHIPGKGEYLGYREVMRVMETLKREIPELYLMAFHGLKEYGLWGFRYIDQHEAYWENEPYMMGNLWSDPSQDRVTANGIRLQSWWNMNFRFLPGCMNHGLAHRMAQNCFSTPKCDHMVDYAGWKYALISAIASGGNVTLPILPHNTDMIPGNDYVAFYQKWIGWVHEHNDWFRHIVPFGGQVEEGLFDGFAGFGKDGGYIALANSAHYRIQATFSLDEEVGLTKNIPHYRLKLLYPYSCDVADDNGKTEFTYGDRLQFHLDGHEIRLYEFVRITPADTIPPLFGLDANPQITANGRVLCLENVSGIYGSVRDCLYRQILDAVFVNGVRLPITHTDSGTRFSFAFGKKKCPKNLLLWKHDEMDFVCPNRTEIDTLRLTATIRHTDMPIKFCEDAKQYLSSACVEAITEYTAQTHRQNTIWAIPDRIYLVFPFTQNPDTITLEVNQKPVPLCFDKVAYHQFQTNTISFADITEALAEQDETELIIQLRDIPAYGFTGAFLYYPQVEETTEIACSEEADCPVSIPVPPIRHGKSTTLCIDAAWMDTGNIVRNNTSFTIYAKTNLEREYVRDLIATVPISIGNTGSTLKHDMTFDYNTSTGLWELHCLAGTRSELIMDPDKIVIHAYDNDNRVSEAFVFSFDWIV